MREASKCPLGMGLAEGREGAEIVSIGRYDGEGDGDINDKGAEQLCLEMLLVLWKYYNS